MKKTITIYQENEEKGSLPLVLVHAVEGDGREIWEECKNLGCHNFNMAVIGNLDWEKDLSPWKEKAIFPKGDDFAGGADDYLKELSENILPYIYDKLNESPEYVVSAGYSLAGLFSIYAAYRVDYLKRVVSASGSLWYPKFLDFAVSSDILSPIDKIYFSVGDKESHTKNKIMATVEDNTRKLEEFFKQCGLMTVFELNSGGHFKDDVKRLARGIKWILENEN